MTTKIELIEPELLGDKDKLAEISHWLRVMNRPNGWHYDLDFIWILRQLEHHNIKPGATILDAGAGQGIFQYLLAARGYNVISLDFSPRSIPSRSRGIFTISGEGDRELDYKHDYMEVITYEPNTSNSWLSRFRKMTYGKIRGFLTSKLAHIIEKYVSSHDQYGNITYIRAPFHAPGIAEKSVDAIVSVSAIEHADIDLFKKNIDSLSALLKSDSPMLITTSAIGGEKSEFNEVVEGWSFSEKYLADMLQPTDVDFNYHDTETKLLKSKNFIDRIDPYYRMHGMLFQDGTGTLPYLPVAIKKIAD